MRKHLNKLSNQTDLEVVMRFVACFSTGASDVSVDPLTHLATEYMKRKSLSGEPGFLP